jgi:hypothetical protein
MVTASASTTTLSADRVAELGYCPPCYTAGTVALVVPGARRCRVHLVDQRLLVETTRKGQARLAAPAGARRRIAHPTGLQTACVSCASAGRDTQGLPRDGDDSDPLCIPCWRGRTDRRAVADRRQLVVELRERLDDVESDDVESDGCAACGNPDPVPTCWLCGYSWLAQARIDHEHAQALEAAAATARFTQLAECTEAETRVAELTGWVDRLRATIEAFAVGGRRGRAVELLADLLYRDATGRDSRRGRPSVLARVAGVLAVDAAARITRPGRLRTAELAGCAPRTVTGCWARAEALEWMVRTVQGRRLSLEERTRLGRTYDRAEFDLAPLGGREQAAARAPYLAAALRVLDELLQHAQELLRAAHDDVDTLTARTGATMDMAAMARRTQLRQAVAQALDTARSAADHLTHHAPNICHPRAASTGMSVYSCWSRGYGCPPPNVHPNRRNRRERRREDGASRSPTRSSGRFDGAGSRPQRRPRPGQELGDASPGRRRVPTWAGWAYDLERALRQRWTWLADENPAQVAATLGAALGEEWTAEGLDNWVRRARGGRGMLAAPDNPRGYLKAVLEEALTGPVAPPHPARRHTEHRRALVAAQAAVNREYRDAARVDHAGRAGQATPVGRRSRAAEAAIATIRARTPAHLRRADRAALLDTPAPAGDCDWPATAQPGSGLPRPV